MRCPPFVLGVPFAIGVVAAPAIAQESGTDARIDYRAPPSCPSEAAFTAQVSARAPRFRRVSSGTSRLFVVQVTPLDGGYRGELTSIDANGARGSREMLGASCDEVLGALGLVLALTVDPTGPATGPVHEVPPRAQASPSDLPPRPGDLPSPPSAAPASAPPSSSGSHAEGATPDARPWHPAHGSLAAGGGAVTSGGVGPGAMLGGTIFAEVGLPARSPWQPAVRIGAQRASSSTVHAGASGAARFTWTVATLDACPLRWSRGRFSLSPCARVDAGVLAGSGSSIARPRDDSRLWLDAGAVARGEWAFAPPLFLGADAAALVAITRPRFHFDVPDVTVDQAAAVGVTASAHFGGRFP